MIKDNRLKAFVAVAERGGFTRAARDLGVTQAAVSQNIAELEKEVGALLFVRARGAVRLTPAGEAFRRYAEQILHWYDAAERMFSGAADPYSRLRPLRIAADPLVSLQLLPDALAALRGAVPGLTVQVLAQDADGADVRILSRSRSTGFTLEDSLSLVGVSEPAVAVSGESPAADLPEDAPLAVWASYQSVLPDDLQARVVFSSGDPSSVLAFVRAASDGTAGIVPSGIAAAGLRLFALPLPSLRRDIHFLPSEDFAVQPLCDRLRQVVEMASGIVSKTI